MNICITQITYDFHYMPFKECYYIFLPKIQITHLKMYMFSFYFLECNIPHTNVVARSRNIPIIPDPASVRHQQHFTSNCTRSQNADKNIYFDAWIVLS